MDKVRGLLPQGVTPSVKTICGDVRTDLNPDAFISLPCPGKDDAGPLRGRLEITVKELLKSVDKLGIAKEIAMFQMGVAITHALYVYLRYYTRSICISSLSLISFSPCIDPHASPSPPHPIVLSFLKGNVSPAERTRPTLSHHTQPFL